VYFTSNIVATVQIDKVGYRSKRVSAEQYVLKWSDKRGNNQTNFRV